MRQWQPVDETDDCFGWLKDEPMRRTSHALRIDGQVWLIDPIDAPDLEGRISALGAPAGVIEVMDRHERDGPAWAERLGVPFLRAWESLDGTPFEVVPILDNRLWHEVALWEPASRTLVCGDVLGTIPFFRAGAERIGLHPFLRVRPPRILLRYAPERVLVGHGGGLYQDASAAVHEAIRTARRRLPAAFVSGVRAVAGARAASR